MTIHCNFHPTQPAHYQCDRCQAALCPKCIDRREKGHLHRGQFLYLCPKCNIEARWLGAGNIIPPFWKRLPQFFTYPLHPRPLGLILVFSFIALVCFEHPSILSFGVIGLLYCSMLLYSFAALKTTAQGSLVPPPVNKSTLSDDFSLVLKQGVMYVIIGFVSAFVGYHLGKAGLRAVVAVSTLGLPAMIILLVTTGSLLQAVNPMMFVPLATRIGWGYLLMFLFLIFLGGAPTAFTRYVIAYLPHRAIPFLFAGAKFYYILISYHLMGYVLMQYHMEIGYHIDRENFRESEAIADTPETESRALQDIAHLLREGNVEKAIQVIREERQTEVRQDLELSERYLKMLELKKMGATLKAHRGVHLALLAQKNQKPQALALYAACRKRYPDFQPSSETLFKIAGWLNESGKAKPALSVFQHIVKNDPESPFAPKASLRMAQIFHDRLMEPAKARRILDHAIENHPENAMIDQIRAYRDRL